MVYLLSPNQMIDNDYRLPTYISPSDHPSIPGVGTKDLPEKVAAVLGRPIGDVAADVEVPPSTSSMTSNGKANGEVDRQRGNLNGGEGWVETPRAEGPPPDGLYPVLAVDCEMVCQTISPPFTADLSSQVLSEDGQELARVSVIDYQSGVNIFDELVKPPKPVTDYRTQSVCPSARGSQLIAHRWSGITPAKISTATHTLSSIQNALSSGPSPLITPHTILLGHSLECDLAALRIRHPLCIDTALLFSHPRGPPFKPGLKWLAQRWLSKDIQGGVKGHDSEEDARTCVDLLKIKMANGRLSALSSRQT